MRSTSHVQNSLYLVMCSCEGLDGYTIDLDEITTLASLTVANQPNVVVLRQSSGLVLERTVPAE